MNWEVRTMRSVTSYFNVPLYQKNLARFWPIWVVYTLFWLFVLPLRFFSIASRFSEDAEHMANALKAAAADVHNMLQPGVALSACVGLAAAMAVFSYLCFHRSTCMMHAMPFDRKGLFFTNYLSGLSFLLLPHLAVFVSTAAVETVYNCLNLPILFEWLWVQSATALFFYSFAVFCTMFTGNIFALPAFYGILNGLAAGVYYLMDNILDEFLYGYTQMGGRWESAAMWLTPAAKLIDSCNIYYSYNDSYGGYAVVTGDHIQAPGAVLIYAGIGLVLTLLALQVYQLRHVESAGDVVAIPIVRPFFKVGVAVCAGMSLGIFTAALLDMYDDAGPGMIVLITLWTAIGAFIAEMLLKKSFRVLRSWKSAIVLSLCMGLVFTGLKLDWFGFESRIPDPENVASVTITNGFSGVPYDDAHYGNAVMVKDDEVVVGDEQRIRSFITLHQAIVKEKWRHDEPGDDYYSIRMDYTLKDGSTLSRYYRSLPVFEGETEAVGSVTRSAHLILQDRELVRQMYNFDAITPDWRLSEAYIDANYWSDRFNGTMSERFYLEEANAADLEQLWQAVLADFEEGTIGVRYLFDRSDERMEHTYTSDLSFVFRKPIIGVNAETSEAFDMAVSQLVPEKEPGFRNKYFSITLTPEASHTLACLAELGGPTPGNGLMTHAEVRTMEEQIKEPF